MRVSGMADRWLTCHQKWWWLGWLWVKVVAARCHCRHGVTLADNWRTDAIIPPLECRSTRTEPASKLSNLTSHFEYSLQILCMLKNSQCIQTKIKLEKNKLKWFGCPCNKSLPRFEFTLRKFRFGLPFADGIIYPDILVPLDWTMANGRSASATIGLSDNEPRASSSTVQKGHQSEQPVEPWVVQCHSARLSMQFYYRH